MEKQYFHFGRFQQLTELERLGRKQPLLLVEGQNKRKVIQFGFKQIVVSREKRRLRKHSNNDCEGDKGRIDLSHIKIIYMTCKNFDR